MTTPLLDVSETQLPWQAEDQRNQQLQQTQQSQDQITPDANSLNNNDYYNRLNTIRQDSASATAGAIAADQTKKANDAALQAAQLAAAQAKAQQDAMNAGNSYMSGGFNGQIIGAAGGNSGWGAGGAQGVANVLRQAGFNEADIPNFMAIAKAESGWDPNAFNGHNSNGTTDSGLFQINSAHQGNSWYPQNLNDPLQSAKAAKAIFDSQGYRAWSTYNSGAYKQFLQPAPPIQPFMANTSNGLQQAQVGQAMSFSGIPTTPSRARALDISKQVLNIPYVWGGDSLKSGVDCSGLVQQVYGQMGISMPRQARAQAVTGQRVSSYNQLQPGDLVAFQWAGGYAGAGTVSHISIYLGNGQIIEAAGGAHGDIRSLGNSAEDRGAIYIHTRFPGE